MTLYKATDAAEYESARSSIKLSDYEFFYTARSQADFTDGEIYNQIVGDISAYKYANPDEEDSTLLGTKINILDVWKHISLVFIDALRDVEAELRKPKNPIRAIVDTIEGDIEAADIGDLKDKIIELNRKLSSIPEISSIGSHINSKLIEMIGTVYSPDIKLESRLKEDFATLARYLTVTPADQQDIDLLGLGHLNILYIALKLVEFDANRNHEVLNIMVIEEPEAHIHTHIQKTLFNNLSVTQDYTQVIMSTHSTHLSEVADIEKVNVMKKLGQRAVVMKPSTGLSSFGELQFKDKNFITSLTRYLDAKRSVLLFSKGVLLVEGDGEEILIPALTKAVLGVSLDELGIGLINIGGIAFENIACIFDERRLQRNCAIITDSDAVVDGATKSNAEAAKRGQTRKTKLDALFAKNPYVEAFYALHTFEVDFADSTNNRSFIKDIIKGTYKQKDKIDKLLTALDSKKESERYDAVLSVAERIQKGWYATRLATEVDYTAIIPRYILEALAFASRDIIDEQVIWKMIKYAFNICSEENDKDLIRQMDDADTHDKRCAFVLEFRKAFSDDMVTEFLNEVESK
ncbi:MAG: AAA family ATPase [Lachnospiraceae bacterium]|jgi:transcription termination factor NusB|nr:AAA family ATPase [Lachnospiraceae bacterium]